jgi:hypothetical protein
VPGGVLGARCSNEYAFKMLDPAVAPEEATSPMKKLWVLAGLRRQMWRPRWVRRHRVSGLEPRPGESA